jgi:hypothetical protein
MAAITVSILSPAGNWGPRRRSGRFKPRSLSMGRRGTYGATKGGEFVARALQEWLAQSGTRIRFIEPCSPWQNGVNESFNARFRDQCLNRELIGSVLEAQVIARAFRVEYNNERPHSRIDYQVPAEYGSRLLGQAPGPGQARQAGPSLRPGLAATSHSADNPEPNPPPALTITRSCPESRVQSASPIRAPLVDDRHLHPHFLRQLPHSALALRRQLDHPQLVVHVVLSARFVFAPVAYAHVVAGAAPIPIGLLTKLVRANRSPVGFRSVESTIFMYNTVCIHLLQAVSVCRHF